MSESLPTRFLTRTSVVAATTATAGLLAAPAAQAQGAVPETPGPGSEGVSVIEEPLQRLFDLLPAQDEPDLALVAEADGDEVIHVIEQGESLASIAAAYGIEGSDGWRRLFDANPELDDPNLIEPGDELRIPAPDEELDQRELPVMTATSGSASAASGSVTAGGGVWDRLAQCEAGGNWSANTGNGFYGGLQFHPGTWNAFGGQQYASYAHQASRAQQIAVAERVLAVQGWSAWPSCSRRLGLR